MKPIVLATDGSPSAAEATLEAVALATAFGAPLVAIAVEHVATPGYGYYGYADLVVEMAKLERDHVEETLAQTKAVAAEAGVECEVVHGTGSVAETIGRLARKRNARMIVIGAHGWGPVRRLWHGSVSGAVLHEAHCPVLVVRGGPELLADSPVPVHETAARCRAAEVVTDVDSYDAVVVGGSLYMGRWHADARRLLRRHRTALEGRPLAVFALGPLTTEEQQVADSSDQLNDALARLGVHPWFVTVFGGVVDPAKLRFPFNRMPQTDARVWPEIEAWATQLGARFSQLAHAEPV